MSWDPLGHCFFPLTFSLLYFQLTGISVFAVRRSFPPTTQKVTSDHFVDPGPK